MTSAEEAEKRSMQAEEAAAERAHGAREERGKDQKIN